MVNIFMVQPKTIWIKSEDEIPAEAERIDNSSKSIQKWRLNGNYYYLLKYPTVHGTHLPKDMGGDISRTEALRNLKDL